MNGSALRVVVDTAKEALAKAAELIEIGYAVLVRDIDGPPLRPGQPKAGARHRRCNGHGGVNCNRVAAAQTHSSD
jgi:hypothetical protein